MTTVDKWKPVDIVPFRRRSFFAPAALFAGITAPIAPLDRAAEYAFSNKVTIDSASVISSNEVDFTLAITFDATTAGFWAGQDGNGTYVRIALPDGTFLKFESMTYDVAGSFAVWHVKVPILYAASPTIVFVHYGRSFPTDGSDRAGAWDASTTLVAHFNQNQTGGAFVDSSMNGNDLVSGGGTTDIAGIIDRCRHYDGGAVGDVIGGSNESAFDLSAADLTVDLWLKPTVSQNSQWMILDKRHGFSGNVSWYMQGNSSGTVDFGYGDGAGWTHGVVSVGNIKDNAWHHLYARLDLGTLLSIVMDGVAGSTMIPTANPGDNNYDIEFGRWAGNGRDFQGDIAEAVITVGAGTVRSDDWGLARRASGLGTWITVGPQIVANAIPSLDEWWREAVVPVLDRTISRSLQPGTVDSLILPVVAPAETILLDKWWREAVIPVLDRAAIHRGLKFVTADPSPLVLKISWRVDIDVAGRFGVTSRGIAKINVKDKIRGS